MAVSLRAFTCVSTLAACAVVLFVSPVLATTAAPSTSPTQTSVNSAPADTTVGPRTVVVVTKPLDPFVIRADDGTLSGFSVDLWTEIGRRQGWKTERQWHEKVTHVIDAVEVSKADAGIAGITINKEREERVDFSHPMFDALQRWTATAGRGVARTVGSTFKDETYGIALPQGSPLREAIDTTLLEIQGDGTYLRLYNKWFTG